MKILNFGSMNIDIFYYVKNIVRPSETIESYDMAQKIGGKGLNQSIALNKSYDKIFHAGKVGEDGLFLINYLKENGIDTSLIEISDKRSGNAIIQVEESGENSIILFHGANFDIDIKYIDHVLDNFDKGDYLIIQNEINNLEYIIDRAYEKGLKIFLNPSPITDELLKANLNKIYMFILNETEAKTLTNTDNLELIKKKLIEKYPNSLFVMTLGKEGSIYFDKKKEIRQKAYKVKAVDTTGAGDTFTGYLISNLANGTSIEKALEMASKASALSVTKSGASNSIPSLNEVENFKELI
ncbi:MAG: ribokinase [Tissierellia bacterium]|nr:ribokinase [Tissierellia bacterium]